MTVEEDAQKRFKNNPKIELFDFNWPDPIELKLKVKDILEENVDEKYFLSEQACNRLLNCTTFKTELTGDIARTLVSSQHKITRGMNIIQMNNPKHSTDRLYSTEGVARSLRASAGGLAAKTGAYAVPVLTRDRLNKRQNGRRFKEDGDPSFTVTSQDRHGVLIINLEEYRIRKLTPIECFRLQGFLKDEVILDNLSDTQRYKLAGNGQSVNVVKKIFNNLFKPKHL